jgi:predicted metalloprotease
MAAGFKAHYIRVMDKIFFSDTDSKFFSTGLLAHSYWKAHITAHHRPQSPIWQCVKK